MRPPLVVPADPSPHRAARLHEAREAVLPDAFLLQAAEETLHDPVLFWGVGCDELLADSVVLAGSPKTPALEDQSVVTGQHRRDTVGPAKALDARRLERPFGLLGAAPPGKLVPDEFAVM